MAERTFTPGPWIASGPVDFRKTSFYIYADARGSTKGAVAHIPRSTDLPSEANARLIAASPDLLEALQEIMVDLCAGYEGPTVDKAYAAIAKALGDV